MIVLSMSIVGVFCVQSHWYISQTEATRIQYKDPQSQVFLQDIASSIPQTHHLRPITITITINYFLSGILV
jgi:hypothetical protein